MHAEAEEDGAGKHSSPVKFVVIAIVIGLLSWKAYTALIADDQSASAVSSSTQQESTDPTTSYDPSRSRQRRAEDKQASTAVDEAFDIDDRTGESSVVAVDRRVNATNERVRKLQQSISAAESQRQRDMAKLQNRVEKKLSQLTNAIESQGENRILEERDALMNGGTGNSSAVDSTGLPALGEQKTASSPQTTAKPKDDFPYMQLGARSSSDNGEGSGLFGGIGAPNTSDESSDRRVADSTSAPPPPSEASNEAKPLTNADNESTLQAKYDTITVPGNAWVHVTDLHGVACPVGNASSAQNQGPSALLSQVPITLPIKGEFHGPNGTSYPMGSPHISGTCVGQESNRPAAIVKIERLSYVGPDGKPQFIPISGYLVDRRDNQMGVAGYLDQASGREIALASFAAGMSAAGEVFSDSQFDTQIFGGGPEGGIGSARSISGSDIPAAVAGDAFGEAFGRIGEYYDRQANRVIPVVRIQAGLPITMITTQPFQYLAANSNAEVSNVN